MKKIVAFCAMLAVVTLFVTVYAISNRENISEVPAEIRIAGEQGLKEIVPIVSGDLKKWELTEKELSGMELQEGYSFYCIDRDKFKKEETLEKMLVKSGMWEFVVACNGKPKSFLTVGFEDGKYKMVHYGGDSKQFQKKANQYIRTSKDKLIKIGCGYYVLKGGKNPRVLPCFEEDESNWLNGRNAGRKSGYTPDEVVKILKENAKKYEGTAVFDTER